MKRAAAPCLEAAALNEGILTCNSCRNRICLPPFGKQAPLQQTAYFPFVAKGIIQMDSDKSLTLHDKTLTLDDHSLSNIAGYDKARHKLIACAANRANIRRIALIQLYFLPQAVDGLCDAAVKIFIRIPHSLIDLPL